MKTIVIYSGGLDSTVLLYALKAQRDEIAAVSFDYGQRHKKELIAASRITRDLGVDHCIVDLHTYGMYIRSSSQTNADVAVPEGHYEDETMRATVVPNRNMIMIALAAGIAMDRGYHEVAYAAHAGDHAIYPDCREEFVHAMMKPLALAHYEPIVLCAPFLRMRKEQIVRDGHSLGVPLHRTWSCYRGELMHCGRCGTCVERREAFAKAGVTDLTEYQDA